MLIKINQMVRLELAIVHNQCILPEIVATQVASIDMLYLTILIQWLPFLIYVVMVIL